MARPREPYLAIPQVAEQLQVSTKTARRHIKPYAQVGGMNRYLRSHVDRQIRKPDEGSTNGGDEG